MRPYYCHICWGGVTLLISVALATIITEDLSEDLTRRLKTNQRFRIEWLKLIEKQQKQLQWTLRNGFGFGLDEFHCDVEIPYAGALNDNVRPNDISIFSSIGGLSTFADCQLDQLRKFNVSGCINQIDDKYGISLKSMVSVPAILRQYNRYMSVIPVRDFREDMKGQFAQVLRQIKRQSHWQRRWKMLLILPGTVDGRFSETGQAAVEVLETIEAIHKSLPENTIVVVMKMSDFGMWLQASESSAACDIQLKKLSLKERNGTDNIWEQVTKIASANFDRPEFSVQVLSSLSGSRLMDFPTGKDVSFFAHNCMHLSKKGFSLLQTAIWNDLVTAFNDRKGRFEPNWLKMGGLMCHDSQCPFIRTTSNSHNCSWTEQEYDYDSAVMNAYLQLPDEPHHETFVSMHPALTALIITAILASILCVVLGCTDSKPRYQSMLVYMRENERPVGVYQRRHVRDSETEMGPISAWGYQSEGLADTHLLDVFRYSPENGGRPSLWGSKFLPPSSDSEK
uniref:Uncharacterized protein n=1 Tax=Plectus sambesii TaxID=2011161 RepID=A0A914X1H6_9BILA